MREELTQLGFEELKSGADVDRVLTQPGTVMRLKDKGLYRKHGARGDAHVVIKVKVPKGLSEESRRGFEEWWGKTDNG